MGVTCSAFGGEVRRIRGFGEETWGKDLEDPYVDERIILRRIFRKWEVGVWTGSSWLRIGTGGGHLWMRKWTFGFHKMWGISWLVISFPQVSLPTPCTRLSAPQSELHAPPTSFFSILSPAKWWARSTDHEAPHYDVFSTPLLPCPS
jgi:hypothetical protein